MAEGLPAAYRDEIERAIGRAVVAADAAAHGEADVPPADVDVEVKRRGRPSATRCSGTSAARSAGGVRAPDPDDLKLPLDMEAGLALAIREAVQQRASSAVSTDVGTAAEVVRSAADAAEWSPEIGRRGRSRRRRRRRRRARAAAAAEARAAAKAGERRAARRVDCGGALERGGVRRAQFGAILARNSARNSLSAHATPSTGTAGGPTSGPRFQRRARSPRCCNRRAAAHLRRRRKDERPGSAALTRSRKRRRSRRRGARAPATRAASGKRA